MHRDSVTRSLGSLLCHSSTTITSCCSMIMHGPMLQGSVHNSCKLKTSKFLPGQHTHRTCHPLSMFKMLWIDVYDSVFQFLPISSNSTAIEEEWTKIPQTTITNQINSMLRRCVALREANKWWSHQILTGFRTFLPPPPQYSKTAHFKVAFYCGQPKSHLCINHSSNQHIDMPHLWGGWVISAKEKCSPTQI